MPIRSPRGRAAAYRAVWGWPLRSPARLAVTAVVVLALVIGVSLVIGATRPDPGPGILGAQPTTGAAPTRAPSTPAPTALPPVAPLTPTTLPVNQAPASALQMAQNWTAAWANHPAGMTNAQWLAGLRPYTTDEYLPTLSNVDPANIPATRITGPATATKVSPASVTADVPTDVVTLKVTLVDTAAGWRVSGYDRV
ncbi:hypothetical protein GCM10009836_71140 [Pseudonocardia ailaonensis]|uniref:DUF3828 domain-containing protein n=1 Tax=Pseudonocardia ailaonensis TaxID=367279 RepID=A0ABN2NPQ3_9PSEU